MKRIKAMIRIGTLGLVTLLVTYLVWPVAVTASDLDENLAQVPGQYAEAYLTPLINALGVNQNSGLYTTAAIGKSKLTFEVGIKVAGTYLAEGDQSFRKYVDITLDESVGIDPSNPLYGEQGVLEMAGPTVFGDTDTDGTASLYVDGILIASVPTITGVVETRWVPLLIPEASVGGIAGFKVTLRGLPSFSAGDLGKIKYFGFGAQYGVNNLFPTLPLDIVVGYFRQDLDIGSIIDTDASSFFLGLSKSSPMLTVYGGGALEKSKINVKYTWTSPGGDMPIEFEKDGIQEARVTLGATLTMGIRINAEVNAGKLAVYSAGIMFGF